MPETGPVEPSDAELIAAVRRGETEQFAELVRRYQPRLFATARRYARRESEIQDIVQDILVKAFQKLDTFRGEAPFEHWLMRLAVHACYDSLRGHQRNRESNLTDISEDQGEWLERFASVPEGATSDAAGAKELVDLLLERLSPANRLIITLLEIEERTVKEISALTGWSMPLVKVRAFRARAEMRKALEQLRKQRKV